VVQSLRQHAQTSLVRTASVVGHTDFLVSLLAQFIDSVLLRVRSVMLPKLHPGMWIFAPALVETERCAVGLGGQHRAGREVRADADDLLRFDLCGAENLGNRLRQNSQIVRWGLQREICGQTSLITATARLD